MFDVVLVKKIHRQRHLAHQLRFLPQRQRSPHFHERYSVDEFHYEMRQFFRRAQAEDMHDVGMADLRECACFVHEARLDGFFRAVPFPE
jgi:hypothetical protein